MFCFVFVVKNIVFPQVIKKQIIPAKNPNRGGEDVNANHFLEVFRKWSLFVEVGVQCKCIVYMYSVSVWCECIV